MGRKRPGNYCQIQSVTWENGILNNKHLQPPTSTETELAVPEQRPLNRREFLAKGGLLAGGVAAAGIAGNAVAQSADSGLW